MRQPGLSLILTASLFLFGCTDTPNSKENSRPTVSGKDRPPLQILMVDAPELEQELASRWQAASDQPIQISNTSSESLLASDKCTADVVIYPNKLMGDFVRREWINALPPSILAIRKTSEGEANAGSDDAEKPKDLSHTWPTRWQSATHFGGKCYAFPLGSANLVAVTRGLDTKIMQEMDALLISPDRSTDSAMELWNRFLTPFEKANNANEPERLKKLKDRVATLTSSEKELLVDRFLWVASTTDAKRRGLFDLVSMRSRLNQPEFAKSAAVLARLAAISPDAFFNEPTSAWSSTISAPTGFSIGWPRTDTKEATDAEIGDSQIAPSVLPISYAAGQGLVASVGKRVKQSAEAARFIAWLGENEQRETLHTLCSRYDLLPDQSDRNSVRDDYRAYQTTIGRDVRSDSLELSMRFAFASEYKALLGDALIRAIVEPSNAGPILIECNEQWNQITLKHDPDLQRVSVEKSQGYVR